MVFMVVSQCWWPVVELHLGLDIRRCLRSFALPTRHTYWFGPSKRNLHGSRQVTKAGGSRCAPCYRVMMEMGCQGSSQAQEWCRMNTLFQRPSLMDTSSLFQSIWWFRSRNGARSKIAEKDPAVPEFLQAVPGRSPRGEHFIYSKSINTVNSLIV